MRTVKNGLQGWTGVLALVLATGLVACGGGETETEPMAEEPTAEAPIDATEDRSSTMPSVSFVMPADGATVSSPMAMEFMA